MEAEPNTYNQSSRLFEVIGRTVVTFQQIEQWLSEVLALLLRMREREDQYLVSAAMSYRQKVDLVVELYPKRRIATMVEVDVMLVRKALYIAEEYRNLVVHSFWAIECAEQTRWMRIKGSLRGRKGFSFNSIEANVEMLEDCTKALSVIREWMLGDAFNLNEAVTTIQQYLHDNSNSFSK